MRTTKTIALLFAVTVLFIFQGCSSAPKQSGFLNGYYKDLQPGPPGGAKLRWLKPGVDFAKYDKIMLDSVVFYLAEDSKDKGIDPEDMSELSKAFDEAMVDALAGYQIVSEPGPGVVRIRTALTKIKKSKPGISAVSSVTPVGLGINIIKKGTTGSWSGSGETDMEMMALDSVSNEVIAVAQDVQTAGFTERFSGYGSAKAAFKHWGERLKAFMDSVRAGKQPPQ